MRRNSRRTSPRLVDPFQLGMEKLEPKVLLACDMRLLSDGTLQIIGDEAAQTVSIVDRGAGNVGVQCQEPGNRLDSRSFSRVSGIKGDLKGGNDVLNYVSNQDVNAALPTLEFLMGTGDDRSNVGATLRGTPDRARGFSFVTRGGAGNDTLVSTINSMTSSAVPTQPVVHGEMHGDGGRDDLKLVSNTSSGGFTLTSRELAPSTDGTATQPGCLIWDLVDGTSGQANAHAMGSEVAEVIELRTDARGIGRTNFDFVMDGGGGVNSLNSYYTVVTGEKQGSIRGINANEKRLEVSGIIDLVASSSSQPTSGRNDGWWQLDFADTPNSSPSVALEIVGSNSADRIQVDVSANDMDRLAIDIDGRDGDDNISYNMFHPDGLPIRATVVKSNGGRGLDRLTTDIRYPRDSADRGSIDVEMRGGEETRLHVNDGEFDLMLDAQAALNDFDIQNSIGNFSSPRLDGFNFQGGANSHQLTTRGFDQTRIDARLTDSFGLETQMSATASRPVDTSTPLALNVLTNNENFSTSVWQLDIPEHASSSFELSHQSLNPLNLKVRQAGFTDLDFIRQRAGTNTFASTAKLIHNQNGGSKVDVENFVIENLEITSSDLHYQRRLANVEIVGSFLEAVDNSGRPVADGTSNTYLVAEHDIYISPQGIFQSTVAGSRASDNVTSRMENVINQGRMVQTIETGTGADVVVQAIEGFANYGTAVFDTRLGAGNDSYLAVANNLYVAPTASFSMQVDGGAGGDVILAAVQAAVDGDYQFGARGQAGNDVIGIVQQFSTNWRSGNSNQDQRPNIKVRAEGNDGNDLIGMWVSISGGNDDLIDALVDGGLGEDTAFTEGPIRVINVEHHN